MESNFAESLARSFRGFQSHPDPVDVFTAIDYETSGSKVEGQPFTIWQISRHLMEWGWLILNKLKNIESKFEADENNFFPAEPSPKSEALWDAHKKAFQALSEEFAAVLKDLDPNQIYPEWDNSTAFELANIFLTHSSYHIGQIVLMLKIMGKWK